MSKIVKNQRILGNKLGFTIGGQDYWSDVAEWSLEAETKDKDVLTFADAQGGTTGNWKLKGKAIQSTQTGSFWKWVWEHTGEVVDFKVAPHGNETPEENRPHFVGKVRVGAKPTIGVSAGEEKGGTFEIEWDIQGEPEIKTAPDSPGLPSPATGA